MVLVGGQSYYGVGAIQGFLTPSKDYGIVDHSLKVQVEPAIDDPIFWPNVLGDQLQLAVRDLKYFHSGIGVISDPNGFFGSTSQMVADMTLEPQDGVIKSCIDDPSNPDPLVTLPMSSITQNRFAQTCQAGYVVTKATGDANGPYVGQTLNAMAETDLLKSNIHNLISYDSNDVQQGGLTGYLIPATTANNAKIQNTTWVGTSAEWDALTTKVEFPVNLKNKDIFIGSLTTIATGATIDRFFDGFGDYATRGTNFGARLSGHSSGPFSSTDGKDWRPVFKGLSKDDEDLYVLAINANHEGGDIDVIPSAHLSGTVQMTDFEPPQGKFCHWESYRLLPNFATGQANSDSYPREAITQGGAYPGMSSLNTMEVFLDITWSAPCGGVENCIEQPA
jgi:hypothetical protein